MTCSKCHRKISNPDSMIHGMGPICWANFVLDRTAQHNIEKTVRLKAETMEAQAIETITMRTTTEQLTLLRMKTQTRNDQLNLFA
jgi:hypothetical protein